MVDFVSIHFSVESVEPTGASLNSAPLGEKESRPEVSAEEGSSAMEVDSVKGSDSVVTVEQKRDEAGKESVVEEVSSW